MLQPRSSSVFIVVAVALAAGCYLVQTFDALPSLSWLLMSPLLILLLALGRWSRSFLIVGSASLLGFLVALAHAHWLMSQLSFERALAADQVLVGTVASLVRVDKIASSFVFKVEADGKRPSFKLRLRWYRPPQPLVPGQRWRLTVRLRPLTAYFNPGGFDSAAFWFRRGVGFSGYVRSGDVASLLETRRWSIERVRSDVDDALSKALESHPQGGLIRALVVGVRDGVDRQQRELLKVTGTAHLLAISGLHIGLVAGLVFWLANTAWRHLGRLPMYLASALFAAVAALSGAVCYAALAGFAVPTQRAAIMIAIGMLALWTRSHFAPMVAFRIAIVLILILDPMTVVDPGAWLSFAAVAALLFGLQGQAAANRLRIFVRVQIVAGLALAPLTLALFGQIAGAGVIANLVAVPVVGATVVPLALLGTTVLALSTGVGTALLHCAADALGALVVVLNFCAELPLVYEHSAAPSLLNLYLAAFGVVIALTRLPMRWLAVLCWLPLFTAKPMPIAVGDARVVVFDVGQGLSVLVQTRGHALLFDTGPGSRRWSIARGQVVPSLQTLDVGHLDVLMVSHADSDHAGGTGPILAAVPVTQLLGDSGGRGGGRQFNPCQSARRWNWDGVQFEILHPMANKKLTRRSASVLQSGASVGTRSRRKRGAARPSRNNDSCVLRVSTSGSSILLPGNIEMAAEIELVNRLNDQLSADVLVAPHHGSKTSSTVTFLSYVRPSTVIFATGRSNRFGMPHAQVVERYKRIGAKQFNTATAGAVVIHFRATEISVETLASQKRRYWHQ